MKRFLTLIAFISILILAINTATASPKPQSDPSVITADNIDRLMLVGVFYNDNDLIFNDYFISADGRIATISGDNLAQVWEIDPDLDAFGDPLVSLNLEAEACEGTCILTAVALHENNIAVGTLNGIFLIFDTDTGDQLLMHREHQGHRINDVIYNVTDESFMSIDDDGIVGYGINMGINSYFQERIWLTAGNPLHAIAVNPTNHDIAVAGGDSLADDPITTIYTWDNSELGPASIINIDEIEGSIQPVYALEYSPDGTMLVSAEGDELSGAILLRLWDTATNELTASMLFIPLERTGIAYPDSITFSPDGSLLGVYFGASRFFVWEVSDLPIMGEAFYDETYYRTFDMATGEVTFSPDGRFVVANSSSVIQVWGIDVE
jgi:WD40 repeat protein